MKSEDLERLKAVVNNVLWVVIQNRTLAESWGVYLFNSKFDAEPDLRNKIAAIYLAGMLDTMAPQIARKLATARFTAQFHSFTSLLTWCDRVKEFLDATGELLSRFTYEEFLLVQFERNRLVHGWLDGETREEIKARWFDTTQKSTTEKFISLKDRLAALQPLFAAGLDVSLARLRDRLIEKQPSGKKQPYWHAIDRLISPGYMEEALVKIYADIGLEWDQTFG